MNMKSPFTQNQSLITQNCTRSHSLLPFFAALLALISALAARAQGGPPFRTDDPDPPGNKHWEINFGFIGDRNPGAGQYQVPDFDINYGLGDRIQLKYELPIAIEETRPQPATGTNPAAPGQVIGGLGESLLGIKWRFYQHHPGDPWIKGRFGTGLLAVFGHHKEQAQPADLAGDSPAGDADEPNLSFGTYPQLFLDNPTTAVPRGLVAPGPNFYLPVEVNGRIGWLRFNADVGYNFGNKILPQSWNRGFLLGREFGNSTEAYLEIYDLQDANRTAAGRGVGNFASGESKQRETTLGLGGRQALNKEKTLNFLLMGGRSWQKVTADNSQPSWIAYVGLQVLLGPKEADTR
jgi:hypothetical protein